VFAMNTVQGWPRASGRGENPLNPSLNALPL
jgi:hypothetical protein